MTSLDLMEAPFGVVAAYGVPRGEERRNLTRVRRNAPSHACASRQCAHVLLPAGVEVVPAHAETALDSVADALGAEVGVRYGDDERLDLVESPAVRHVQDHGAGLEIAQTDLVGGVAFPQVLRRDDLG